VPDGARPRCDLAHRKDDVTEERGVAADEDPQGRRSTPAPMATWAPKRSSGESAGRTQEPPAPTLPEMGRRVIDRAPPP
jgi:hypothetical protein